MDHFGLAQHLTAIVGATLDERTLSAKADIVAEALRRLEAAGVDISRPVLVGDRHHDVEGGAVHGVPVIFVRWGFSWPHEADGAQAAVDDVDQLREPFSWSTAQMPDAIASALGWIIPALVVFGATPSSSSSPCGSCGARGAPREHAAPPSPSARPPAQRSCASTTLSPSSSSRWDSRVPSTEAARRHPFGVPG